MLTMARSIVCSPDPMPPSPSNYNMHLRVDMSAHDGVPSSTVHSPHQTNTNWVNETPTSSSVAAGEQHRGPNSSTAERVPDRLSRAPVLTANDRHGGGINEPPSMRAANRNDSNPTQTVSLFDPGRRQQQSLSSETRRFKYDKPMHFIRYAMAVTDTPPQSRQSSTPHGSQRT